jgi:hypothetical protein
MKRQNRVQRSQRALVYERVGTNHYRPGNPNVSCKAEYGGLAAHDIKGYRSWNTIQKRWKQCKIFAFLDAKEAEVNQSDAAPNRSVRHAGCSPEERAAQPSRQPPR